MRIGVLADSHDNLVKLKKAVKIFNQRKLDFVFHLGDFVAPFSAALLNQLFCPWLGVFGNNDGEKEGLLKVSKERIKVAPWYVELDSRKIILVHDINTIELRRENAEIILCGHTHRPKVETRDLLFILNPGECGGWLTAKSTVAIIDLKNLVSNIIRI